MQELYYNGKLILGVDHGYGNMKTAHRVFAASVEKEVQLGAVSLEYKGKEYGIGGGHKEFQVQKPHDGDYWILTLAAIAEELKFRGRNEAVIHLAAGVPLFWVKEQKESFREYLLCEKDVHFKYNGEPYHVTITDASIHQQGFAAFINYNGDIGGNTVLADIGNGTMNVAFMQNGKPYYEWQEQKKGQSWKVQMKSDMDEAIREACSYEDFISRMRSKGYTVKGETFGDNSLKYLSFSASGQNRFTRVSEKNFGKGYTKEAIREKIENRVKKQNYSSVKKKVPFPKKPDSKRVLIDTDNEKFQESLGLKHWADIQNLKIAAASYAEGGFIEALEQKIIEKNVIAKTARSDMVKLEHEMKTKAEILKYAKQYAENRKYQRGYEKAKDQDSYFRKHETQIILFGGAENMLKRYGIKVASLDLENLQAEYDAMAVQKIQLRKIYQMAEKEASEADKQLKNIRQYLGIEKEKQEASKPKKKHEMNL